jgi:hypothetical protein
MAEPENTTQPGEIELLIPSDSADYLEPRPHAAEYSSPIEIEGHQIELGGPLAFRKPLIPASTVACRDGRI